MLSSFDQVHQTYMNVERPLGLEAICLSYNILFGSSHDVQDIFDQEYVMTLTLLLSGILMDQLSGTCPDACLHKPSLTTISNQVFQQFIVFINRTTDWFLPLFFS